MDYVVFGTGYGATLLLLGWALRTFAPNLRYQDSNDGSIMRADTILARISWRRFVAALGAVIATAGAVLIFVTMVLILINPGDDTGASIAWICFALILIVVAIWTWLYVGRYGSHGILLERREEPTIFRSTRRETADIAPAESSAAQETAGTDDTPEHHDEVDEEAMEDEVYDDVGAHVYDAMAWDEQESRYAKYQLHHPDNVPGEERHGDDTPLTPVKDEDGAVVPVPDEGVPLEEADELVTTGEEVIPDAPEERLTARATEPHLAEDNGLQLPDATQRDADSELAPEEEEPVEAVVESAGDAVQPEAELLPSEVKAEDTPGETLESAPAPGETVEGRVEALQRPREEGTGDNDEEER